MNLAAAVFISYVSGYIGGMISAKFSEPGKRKLAKLKRELALEQERRGMLLSAQNRFGSSYYTDRWINSNVLIKQLQHDINLLEEKTKE